MKNILQLDFRNREVCINFLKTIKQTRVEGLVIENFFSDVFDSRLRNSGYYYLDCMVLRRLTSGSQGEFLVYPRRTLVDYIKIRPFLEKTGEPVSMLYLDKKNARLFRSQTDDGVNISVIEEFLPTNSETRRTHNSYQGDNSDRINQMFYGYGLVHEERFYEYVQEIAIKDYYIPAYNSIMWDFDRFYINDDNELIYLEIKHKYPTQNLKFGLNNGEKDQIYSFIQTGVKVFYIILVKPYWEKKVSAMYIFVDKTAREKSTWIGGQVLKENFFEAGSRQADKSTSIYGTNTMSYSTIQANRFYVIGSNNLSNEKLSISLINIFNGGFELSRLEEETLKDIQIQ